MSDQTRWRLPSRRSSERQAAIERKVTLPARSVFSGTNGKVNLGGGGISHSPPRIDFGPGGSNGSIDLEDDVVITTPDGSVIIDPGGSVTFPGGGGSINPGGGNIINPGGGDVDLGTGSGIGGPGSTVVTISGTGTTGRMTQWAGASSLTNSTLIKSGAGVLTLSAASTQTLTLSSGGTLALGGFTLTLDGNLRASGTGASSGDVLQYDGTKFAPAALATGTVDGTGVTGRISQWSDADTLTSATLIKSGVGVLTLSAGSAYTLTVPATGTAVLGTGTSGRLVEWGGTNDVNASTLIKSGAGVLTLSAASTYTLTLSGSINLNGAGASSGDVLRHNGTAFIAAALTTSDVSGAIDGTGAAGRITEWTDTNTIEASTLIKSGAGVLTLSAGSTYTLTVPATGTAALGTGTNGRVTLWSGTNTLSSSAGLVFDTASSELTVSGDVIAGADVWALEGLRVGGLAGSVGTGEIKAQGRITAGSYIQTSAGNDWDLGTFSATVITPTGRVSISIGGTTYYLAARPA
jgi:fibronectin-binding autotransporter adhesin